MGEQLSHYPDYLKEFIQVAGIQWPVSVEYGSVSGFCLITDAVKKRHTIITSSELVEPATGDFLKYKEFHYAHEIGHAWLAENIDLVFSSQLIDCGIDGSSWEERRLAVGTVTDFADIWANDAIIDVIDRGDLVKTMVQMWSRRSKRIFSRNPQNFILEFASMYGTAVRNKMEREEHELSRIRANLQNTMGIKLSGQMLEITELCVGLPRITLDPTGATECFVETTGQYLDILEIQPRPKLVKEDNYYIWRF